MFSRAAVFVLSLAVAAFAADGPDPTLPDPGHIFNEGSTCQIGWTPDTTGTWKTMNIQLMTGNNFQMVPLTTVATVDGTTSPGTFSYPCPAVTIHSAIYFYQFSHAANASDLRWTGRFAIAFPNGTTVPAPNLTEPDGEGIPWGNGGLTDPSKAVAPPSYLPPSGSNSTTSPSSAAVSSSAMSSVAALPTNAASPSTSGSPSGSASAGSAAASNANGALVLGTLSARAAQAGVALAAIACAFTVMV